MNSARPNRLALLSAWLSIPVLLFALVACNSAGSNDNAQPPAPPIPPRPEPPGPPTPPKPPDPVPVVDRTRVDAVPIGATEAEVRAALGTPFKVSTVDGQRVLVYSVGVLFAELWLGPDGRVVQKRWV